MTTIIFLILIFSSQKKKTSPGKRNTLNGPLKARGNIEWASFSGTTHRDSRRFGLVWMKDNQS